MKILISLMGLVILMLILIFGLGIFSHFKNPGSGIVDGKLGACPDSPNCVCSESYPDKQEIHAISPIKIVGGDIDSLWQLIRDGVITSGGKVTEENSGYLRAEFTSTIFRFVDDLELRLDREQNEIHIRSASRVGYSDLGTNRKRVEQIWRNLGDGS